MPLQLITLVVFITLNILLLGIVRFRPQLVSSAGGKGLALLALFALPAAILVGGTAHHLENAKTTEFCLSCHDVMEPYGRSLLIDDPEYLPASHFQNSRVPPEQACYACHTSYAMFGDLQAKFNGVVHLYVNYFGTIPDPLSLYQPYQNRECLHCHANARSFEENGFHEGIRAELARNEVSCLECHSSVHAVAELDRLPVWTPPATESGGDQ